MAAGSATPLHLAASLLALSVAVGLSTLAITRPSGLAARRSGDLLTATGALAVAASYALTGALAQGSGDLIGWLRAGGLALIALGGLPSTLGTGGLPVVFVPVGSVAADAVAAVSAAAVAVRGLLVGGSAVLASAGFAAWGVAVAVERTSVAAADWLTLVGAGALGAWLWQTASRRLRAKFVIAFVASVVVLVSAMAGVLSSVGSREIVADELGRLADRSERLADEIAGEWPREAVADASVVRNQGAQLTAYQPSDTDRLAGLFQAFFREQDYYAVINGAGQPLYTYAPDPDVNGGAFQLALAGSSVTDALLGGATDASDVITVGGRIVAVGGVRLDPENARAGEPPLGVLLTGRVADDLYTARAADQFGVGVIIEVGNNLSSASADVAEYGLPLLEVLGERERVQARVSGDALYAAAAAVSDASGVPRGRLITVSPADVVAQLEQGQARRLFLLALVAALLAGLVGVALAGRLVAPIQRLTRAAAAVREGDLRAQAEVTTRDEVGDLGRTFNEMTSSLAQQSSQLREAAAVEGRLRARLEALTESMGDALVAVDDADKVVTFNRAAERLTGRIAQNALGRPLADVIAGQDAQDRPPAEVLGAAAGEEVVSAQLLLEDVEGRLVPVAATAAPVRAFDGRSLGRVLVLRDVSREAEIERMKSQFLSNVSHELRTPLTPIKGYAELLANRDVGPDKTRQFSREILDASNRMERVVGLIVDFAAMDSGRVRLSREPTDVGHVVGEVVTRWRARVPGRDFRRRVAQGLPPVLVDPAMLRRCLDELVDNAVKFSPGGEPVSLAAARERSPAGEDVVRLSVRDLGVGIEPETVARLFGDFFQGDASETRHFGGLGLGLALVRRIAEGMGVDVEVESEPGSGSIFSLVLPSADSFVERSGRSNGSGRRKARKSRPRAR